MRRLGNSPKTESLENRANNDWFSTVGERFHIYSGINNPTTGEVPDNQWVIYKNTTSGLTQFWSNWGGVLTPISGTGTVTTVSVVSANGFAGTVATAASTPAITLTTTITGLLKGNGTAISAASAGTDYEAPIAAGTTTQYWRGDKSWQTLNATAVGLSNVTNDVQTKAAIVPNTVPSAGQILVGNAGGTAYALVSASGAVTVASTGAFTLATPGTLTVATTNSTATAHTHAITSSNSPGAAASLIATDASGHIGTTGTRIVKGWFADLTVTNIIAGSINGNAATVTTNANLTGVITSSGNATSIASQTGTGTKFVVDTTPTLITPVLGVATGTSLAVTGLLSSSGTAGIGYASGAGGTVTQLTSKGTGVALAKMCGDITLNAAALAAGANTSFVFSNTLMAGTDSIVIWHNSGGTAWAYDIKWQVAGGGGGCTVNIKNNTAGSLSESPVLRYFVIKAVTA